jgi:hypothetical protein
LLLKPQLVHPVGCLPEDRLDLVRASHGSALVLHEGSFVEEGLLTKFAGIQRLGHLNLHLSKCQRVMITF